MDWRWKSSSGLDGWIEDENLPPGWMNGMKMKQLQSRNYHCRLLGTIIQKFFYSIQKKILIFSYSVGGLGCFAHSNVYFAHIFLLTINTIMAKTIANICCLSLLCEKMGKLFCGTVPPNNTLFDRTDDSAKWYFVQRKVLDFMDHMNLAHLKEKIALKFNIPFCPES